MSWGWPKWASIRRPSRASSTICASVSTGCCCRSASIATSCVPPAGERGDGDPLGGDRPGHDVAVAHGVDVWAHEAGDERLTEPEAGLHGAELPVGRDRVGREQDAGRLWEDHLLHDHGHAGLAVVEAVVQPVGHGALGEQGGPAPADVREHGRRPHHVQVGVLLAGEGGRRRIFRRRAGPDGAGAALAEPGERSGDRGRQICRVSRRLRGPRRMSALTVRIASRSAGLRSDSRSRPSSINGASAKIRRKASVVTQKPAGTRTPSIRANSPRRAPFPPTDRDLGLVDIPQIHARHRSSVHLPLGSAGVPDFGCGRWPRRWPPSELRPALSADRWSLRQAPHLHVRCCWRGWSGAPVRRVRRIAPRRGWPLSDLRDAARAAGRAGPRGARRSRWPARATPWDRRPEGRGGCRRGARARRARGTCGIRACRAPAGC